MQTGLDDAPLGLPKLRLMLWLAFDLCRHCDDSVEKAVSRVLDIWEERGIYDDHAVGLLRPRSDQP